jgi:7-cyano-7-deazaguanine synthase
LAPKTVLKQAGKKSGAVCVLASGGAMTERYDRVIPVYVRNGLVWEKAELHWLRRFLRAAAHPSIGALQVLDLPMKDVYGTHWSMTGTAVPDEASGWEEVYLPGRNLILLSKAAVYCGLNDIGAIALGPLKTNRFADSSPEFFEEFRKSVERAMGRHFEILAPFAHLSKREVMEQGRRLPLDGPPDEHRAARTDRLSHG